MTRDHAHSHSSPRAQPRCSCSATALEATRRSVPRAKTPTEHSWTRQGAWAGATPRPNSRGSALSLPRFALFLFYPFAVRSHHSGAIANSWAVRSLLIGARCSHQRTKRVRMARATRARSPPPLSYSVASLLPTSFGQVNNPPHETSFLSTVRHSRWTRRFTCGTGETDANGTTYTCVYCPMVTLVNSTRLVALGTCTPSGCPGCNGIHLRQGIAVFAPVLKAV